VIAGGYPLIVDVQGRERIATVGCLVTDGSRYYGLTNRHVCGEAGRPIFANLAAGRQQVGRSAARELQLSKVAFSQMYPGWSGSHLFVNADIGLVDIDDVNGWKTEIFRLGEIGPLADFNVNTLNLSVIGKQVRGFGAGSGPIAGQVSALFYRYRMAGGMEYVADFLIGPTSDKGGVVRRGDSGAVLCLQLPSGLRPFAVTWGTHEFVDGPTRTTLGFGLATGLGNVCRLLDVDLVRGWNVDQPYTWGKTGHFKIGFRAADLVSDKKLAKLLEANQPNLGYSNEDLEADNVVGGTFTHDFVPLADVADIVWRTTRPEDESNHFSDIDESDPSVYDGKSLLELSLESDNNIDVDVWLDFDRKMDAVKPIYRTNRDGQKVLRPREGALPFRVWQMYKQMIASLSDRKIDEFIVAGGTMAHYVGDACQPLHVSYLHHGADPSESAVHSDYETKLIDVKRGDLFAGVDAIKTQVSKAQMIGLDGREAAKLVLHLMKDTVDRLPPEEVVQVWREERGRGRYDRMWSRLGKRTIANVAAGSHAMAVLWQSAWKHGGGADLTDAKLKKIPESTLQKIYNRKTFVPSIRLSNAAEYKGVL
jgi:hypothetical protein